MIRSDSRPAQWPVVSHCPQEVLFLTGPPHSAFNLIAVATQLLNSPQPARIDRSQLLVGAGAGTVILPAECSMVSALTGSSSPAAAATAAGARAPAGPPSKKPPTVVLLHGLLRNASHMEPLRRCTLTRLFCRIFQMQRQRRLVLAHSPALQSAFCESAPLRSAMLRSCGRGVLAGTSIRLQDTLRIPLGTRQKLTPSRCSADPPLRR